MDTNIRQNQTPGNVNRTDRWSIHVPIGTSKDTDQSVDTWQDDKLWINISDNYIETGQRQDFNDYELAQEEYLKSSTVTDKLERMYPPDRWNIQNDRQTGHYSQAQRDKKIDRMSDLKREMEYLVMGMQRIRMTLTKLQEDPTQIPVTSRVGSRPKNYKSTRL